MSTTPAYEKASNVANAALPDRLTQCMAELHMLSKLPRIGLILAGVNGPQSIAEHSYETALISYLLCQHLPKPVDTQKVLVMSLFHETGEVRTTNQPPRAKPYLGNAKDRAEVQVTQDVLRGIAEGIIPILNERDEGRTLESHVSLAAEDLQVLFTVMMYAREHNGDLGEFRKDAERFDARGIELAEQVAEIVSQRLGEYLGDQPYWEIGYDHDPKEAR